MKKTLLAVALAPVCLQSNVFAADVDADETMVVISRSTNVNSIADIPANVTVIDHNDIQATGAKDLVSLLRGRAGIQVSDTNSGPVFSLRGFSGEQAAHNTLILLDGRRLNKDDLSAPRLNAIALSQVERVEILSGSAGVLYGDQAVGGVINIITKSPNMTGGSVGATGGSFDTYGYRADVSGLMNDSWSYYLAGNQINSDNYRDHNDNEDGSVLGRLEYRKDDKRFFAEVSYLDAYREYAGSLTKAQFEANPEQANPSNAEDYNHEITTAYRVGYRQSIVESWDVNVEVTYDETGANGRSFGSANTKDSEHLFTAVQLEGALPAKYGNINVLLGMDFSNNEFDYLSSFIDRDNEQEMLSFYAQVQYPVSNDLVLTVGGRYSKVEDQLRDKVSYSTPSNLDESAHALELAANYYLNEEHRVYVRVDENFRFAKVDEQAFTSPGVIGLKPQTGHSIESGWSYTGLAYSTNLNLYRLDLEDEIVFDSSAQSPAGSFFQGANVNADATRRYGVDVSGYWDVSEIVSLGAEYHFVDAEFVKGSNDGKDISWVAPHTGRAFGTFEFMRDWQFFAEAVYTGTRYKDGDNANSQEKLEAYWLLNTALNYMVNDWRASLRVDNLADESYPSSANQWGAYYPGDGRKVSFTVDYQF